MNKKNTAALVLAAPLLYRLYGTTKSGWSIQYGFECGDGWFDLLTRLSVKIETELQAMLAAGKRRQDLPHALQVKEKFGMLRFYVGGQLEHWREWIEEACAESARTCELCGQPGELSERGGWVATLCPRHLMLSGHVPNDYGEFYFVGSDECPDSRKASRDGLNLLGVIKLATGNLDVWAPGKGLSRALVYADELPPALWPALSRLADDQGEIPVAKVTNYLYENRWQPNVRAVLGLPAVAPGDFVEEASRLIRHKDMELVGSVVLPGHKAAAPVFVPYDEPGLKIVAWEFMPESVSDEFKKWHFGGQHEKGPYLHDFNAWVRSLDKSTDVSASVFFRWGATAKVRFGDENFDDIQKEDEDF